MTKMTAVMILMLKMRRRIGDRNGDEEGHKEKMKEGYGMR